MRRLLTTGLVLATLATVLMAAPAQAHEQYTNGCSVPGLPQGGGDRGFGFDFHAACDAHDLCYVYHAAGEYEPGRKACDDMFFYLMRQSVWRMTWWNWHPDAGMVWRRATTGLSAQVASSRSTTTGDRHGPT
jgi:hypothetical protein